LNKLLKTSANPLELAVSCFAFPAAANLQIRIGDHSIARIGSDILIGVT
jgi:hypothetical protein